MNRRVPLGGRRVCRIAWGVACACTVTIGVFAFGAEGGGAAAADAIFGVRPAAGQRPPVEPQAPAAADDGRDVERRIETLEKSMDAVESRLGRTTQPPSLSNNMERRLQDLEKRLAALERETKRMDERLRKVESRKP
ncbi:MAG: hypothetical protein KJ579_05765 [Verrucomicrobia bacterium]|nr:hypothetical protein [Verrucomicrobiota bacterium]